MNNETGLTDDEDKCMNALVEAYNSYFKLPQDHPSELSEFVSSIHRLQDLLAVRIARRNFPKGWPSYIPNDIRYI
jgi:hypothetical protein